MSTHPESVRPDLPRLAARLPPAPRTRFAPSPTGFLHLGHVVNAVYVWGLAQALGGSVTLRVEDHDRQRSRPEFEHAMLEDLAWLGLTDLASDVSSRAAPPARQSGRDAVYRDALASLRTRGLVYACGCSRKQIAGVSGTGGPELWYPGTCRQMGLPLDDALGLRVRLDDVTEAFDDGLLGPQEQAPARQCGDLLVRDRHGGWTYQFAVTVDDLEQEIDLVVRGQDLLASTGRQIQLARLLGRATPPVYVHHPLVLGPSGAKLSKSNRDVGIRELRAAGHPPSEVLGLAAAAVGLLDRPRPFDAGDLAAVFAA